MNSSTNQGLLLVVSGPSGVGKSTITKVVRDRINTAFSVSMTTRPKSKQDCEGADYYFISEDRFKQAIENNELLEWALVFGNYYGTPRQPVIENIKAGKIELLEIDVQGGIQIRENYPDALMIFILPPSEETLLQRLRDRARDTETVIQCRFAEAKHEIKKAQSSGAYDHFVVNDNLEQAIDDVVALIQQRQNTILNT